RAAGRDASSHAHASTPPPGAPAMERADHTHLTGGSRKGKSAGRGDGRDRRRTRRRRTTVAGTRRHTGRGDRGDIDGDQPRLLPRRRVEAWCNNDDVTSLHTISTS